MASGTEQPALGSEGCTLVLSDDDEEVTDDKGTSSTAMDTSTPSTAMDISTPSTAMDISTPNPTEPKESMEKGSCGSSEQVADEGVTSEEDGKDVEEPPSTEDGKISQPASEDKKELPSDVTVSNETEESSEKKNEMDLEEGQQIPNEMGDGKPSEDQNVKSTSDEVVFVELDEEELENELAKSAIAGDTSVDSDSTIVMDSVDIQKAVDIADHASDEAKGSKGDTEAGLDSAVVKKDKEEIDIDNQEHNQKKTIDEGSTEAMDGKSSMEPEEVKSNVEPEVPEGSPTQKKAPQQETFRSLDLPIHPVNEARRSRTRQRSEEHPLERSPSVASNRSEDSSGTGSSKQRRKDQLADAQRERRKSGTSSKGTSGKMVRAGFEFKAGFRLEAQDFSLKW